MQNLSTPELREQAITELETNFLQALRDSGIELSPDVVCTMDRYRIELGVAATGEYKKKGHKKAFASDIDLHSAQPENVYGGRENEINFGSSGSFTPSDTAPYWRTIHAANILQHWEAACEAVNAYCKKYDDLMRDIREKK